MTLAAPSQFKFTLCLGRLHLRPRISSYEQQQTHTSLSTSSLHDCTHFRFTDMAPGDSWLEPTGWAKKLQEDMEPLPGSSARHMNRRVGTVESSSSSSHPSRPPRRPPLLPSWLAAPAEDADAKPSPPAYNQQQTTSYGENCCSPSNGPTSYPPSSIPKASRKSAPMPPSSTWSQQTHSSPTRSSSTTRQTRNTSDNPKTSDVWDDAEALQCWTMFWSPHFEPINRMQSSLKQANAFNGWRRQNGYEGKSRTWKGMEQLIEGFKNGGVSLDELRTNVTCSGYGDGSRDGMRGSDAKPFMGRGTPSLAAAAAKVVAKSLTRLSTPPPVTARPNAMAGTYTSAPASARSMTATSASESSKKRAISTQLNPDGLPNIYPDVRRKLFTNTGPAKMPSLRNRPGHSPPQTTVSGMQSLPLGATPQLSDRPLAAPTSTSITVQPPNRDVVAPMMSAELTKRFGALTPEQMQTALETLGFRKKASQGSTTTQSAAERSLASSTSMDVGAQPAMQRKGMGTGASAQSSVSLPARNMQAGTAQLTQGTATMTGQLELKRRKTANPLIGSASAPQVPDVRRQLFLRGPSSHQPPVLAPMPHPIAHANSARTAATPPRIRPTASSMRAATTTLFPGALAPRLPANTFREIPASAMNSEIAAYAKITRLMKTMIKEYIAKGGRPEDARQAVGILAREAEEKAREAED